ncbi:hypothetical protein ABW19_dt0202753 [Dactylella cylindrospora]|nr:hypothetical protein ABW19_dt0202753 [Dactylella cylindrospora]
MASFGRLTASAIAGSVENTLALANLNFDFSLIKVAAPKEFEGVGTSLSALRRSEAEDGKAHRTARKLAALFEPLLPQTPHLINAYGERASEISQSPIGKGDGVKNSGLFSQHAGRDGTSLWAAATSGQAAIKLHLLACMLARMWSASEATSIWVEFVAERKRRILTEFEDAGTLAKTYLAAQQNIPRPQLADWDASARAWLRTADRVKKLQQTQLELILKNVKIFVNSKPAVYDSVFQAWITALEGLECLIQGMPQRAYSGEILVGLCSWHIYPDLLILDTQDIKVSQRDSLVSPAGLLTISTQIDSEARENGVQWSLPLAHLKYYGKPVLSSRNLSTDGSRLNYDEFFQAVLGAVIGRTVPYEPSEKLQFDMVQVVAEWFIAVYELLSSSDRVPNSRIDQSWIFLLAQSSRFFLESEGLDRQINLNLVNLGNRQSSKFLPLFNDKEPMLGFLSLWSVLTLVTEKESQIMVLRKYSERLQHPANDLLIRYTIDYPEGTLFEYTTAKPYQRSSTKRNGSNEGVKSTGHIRWIHPFSPSPGKL